MASDPLDLDAIRALRRAHPELGEDEAEQILRYLPVAGAELSEALRAALDAGQADSAVLAAALRALAESFPAKTPGSQTA